MASVLISGTDTDVGKTWVSVSLAAYWQQYRYHYSPKNNDLKNQLAIFKLIQTGIGDYELYDRLFAEEAAIKVATPLCFTTPIAPPLAAAKENKIIDLGKIWQALQTLTAQNFVLIEAIGGLGSPVTSELTVADLAAEWRLPTVLVVPVKLGAIAHAVANVALARSLNVDLKGIILSCTNSESASRLEDLTPVDLIESLTQTPILGILPYISELTDLNKLAKVSSSWDLEVILPN